MTSIELVERWRRILNLGPKASEAEIVDVIHELAFRSYLRGDSLPFGALGGDSDG